jgi:hypothetical protein
MPRTAPQRRGGSARSGQARHAGGLDENAIELGTTKEAPIAAPHHVGERVRQIRADRAADASVGQLDDVLAIDELSVDPHVGELVHDHGHLLAMLRGQDAVDEGGLAAAEETGQESHGNAVRRLVHE